MNRPADASLPRRARLARARATFSNALSGLLNPDGLPRGGSAELEDALGAVGRSALSAGPGRIRRIRAQIAATPPRLLDWASLQVIERPAPVFDGRGVEDLAARQARSIGKAVGAVQLALVTVAAASTLEGGPLVAIVIDGVVGQIASIVHGVCDWYAAGSYVARRLEDADRRPTAFEARRLTTAALVSKGGTIDPTALDGPAELRLVRTWAWHGVVDALPFGSALGKGAVRAAARIDNTDLVAMLDRLRAAPEAV